MSTLSSSVGIFARNLAFCAFGVGSFVLVVGNRWSVSDDTYYLGSAVIGIVAAVLYSIHDLCKQSD